MKTKKTDRNTAIIFFIIIILSILFAFRNQAYTFLTSFSKIEAVLESFNIDEYIKENIDKKILQVLNQSERVEDKNLFDLFHFTKKMKSKQQDFNEFRYNDKVLINIQKTEFSSSLLTYQYGNDKKTTIQVNSIILVPGEIISCDCLDNLLNKTLIFESKGVPANKLDTMSYLNITYEDKTFDNLEIKNNQITKIKITQPKEGKTIAITWNKNSSGVLFFRGVDNTEYKNKSIFITIKSKNLSDNFLNKINEIFPKEYTYYNKNSFPISSKYSQNIKTLETFTSQINNGFTYNSQDLFKEKEKNFFNLINSNFKDLLRINVFNKKNDDESIEFANTLVKINRESSISNIDSLIPDIVNNSNAEFVRIDINPNSDDNEDILYNIIKKLDKKSNLFIINGNNFDFNKSTLQSNQSILMIIPNSSMINIMNYIKTTYDKNPIQQNIVTDILNKIIRNKEITKENLTKQNTIVVQSEKEEAFIFNKENYFTNKNFSIPFNKMKQFLSIIDEQRSKYQMRDLVFSFSNLKSAKLKIYSKDRILRCFSNKNIKIGQFSFDLKQEYYNVELKIQSEEVIDEWQVSCLLNGDSFSNDYRIEAQKDGKQLNQLQIGMGEYVAHPNGNFIVSNSLNFNNFTDFSLLYSFESPRKSYSHLSEDLIVWSHFFPSLPANLKYFITYKERK
ncbi:hypothetical protein [Silvanigrella aquatica]|uniref:Uncharacterized protein n=1 Tax=Silvanigrella aquatica TaxID=1915309 RepID=A0A1L4D1U9_9BACT|nr:hypothetical protein [Silvanigrella aquatica]APJ04164.1 hypothetical protein AXG55_09715 [Silvanigrella aquatica]